MSKGWKARSRNKPDLLIGSEKPRHVWRGFFYSTGAAIAMVREITHPTFRFAVFEMQRGGFFSLYTSTSPVPTVTR